MRTLPMVEALVVHYLTQHPDVSAAVGSRVYAVALPGNVTRPCVRVTRYGGSPVIQSPALELDRADLQVDVWGATNQATASLAAVVRSALAQMPGRHDGPAPGVVTAVTFGPFSTSPDTERDPVWPRVIADVSVVYRPA